MALSGVNGRAGAGSHGGALAVIGLAQLMVVLDGTILNIALPSAQQALGFSNDDRQWIVTAYALAFASLLLLGGRLADLLGRRNTFIAGIIGFAAASALGGAANGFTVLIIARSVQGMFAALLAPAALSLLTTTFTEPRERARAFGIYGAIGGSGAAVGLLLGGALTQYLDWRWTLYVNVALAFVALAGAVVVIPNSARPPRAWLDVPGVLLVSTGLFGIVFGVSNAETHSWGDWMTWGFLAAGAGILVAFVGWQHRAKYPLLPLSVVADRNRGAALVTVFIGTAGLFGVFFFLTFYLQDTLGYPPLENGVAFLPMVGMIVLDAQLSTNVLVPRFGPKVVVPAGLLLAAAGMVWLTRLGLQNSYAPDVLPGLLLIGAGVGLALPAAMSRATLGVPMSDQGVASAATNATQQLGAAISTALLNTLATGATAAFLAQHLGVPLDAANATVHGYAVAYWYAAGIFAAGALVTALLFRSRHAALATASSATQPPPGRAGPALAVPRDVSDGQARSA